MRTLIALTAATLLLVAACGDDDDTDEATGGGGAAADLVARDFSFEPDTIEVEPGETVTLTVANEGNADHSFTIEELNVDQDVEPGEEAEVEVTAPDEAGTVEFICTFHPSQMTGTLQVGEGGGGDSPTTVEATDDPAAGY